MPSVFAREHRTGVSRTLLTMLVLAALLVLPVTAPPQVLGASLKDQIAAAKDRQAELATSISKSQDLVEELKREEAATRNELAATRTELQDIHADQEAVKKHIEQVSDRLERIEDRHAELVDEQRQTDFTLGLLEQELANGEQDLKARRQALGMRLAEAARTENTTLLDQIFTADSFSDVLTDTSAYLSYGDQDAQLARKIGEDQQALDSLRLLTTSTRLQTDQLRRATLETQAQVEELRENLRLAKARLLKLEKQTQAAKERQEAYMRSLAATKKEAQQRVREQIAARATLRARINNMQAAQQRGQRHVRWYPRRQRRRPVHLAGERLHQPALRLHGLLGQPAARFLRPLPRRHRHRGPHRLAHPGRRLRGRGLHRLQPLGVGACLHRGHRPWRQHLHPLRAHACPATRSARARSCARAR